MFFSLGNLLSPLYPLIALFSALFAGKDDDEPEDGDQNSDKGQAGEQGDDEPDDEGDDDKGDDGDSDEEDADDDDLDDEIDQEEFNGRNADSAIGKKDQQVEASLMSLVRTMVKHPDSAEDTIKDLQSEQPKLASRLAKMYEGKKNESLKTALKDAPESVQKLLSKLVDDVGSLKTKSEQDQVAQERRVYKEWEGASHPYLNPKNELAKTEVGKKLIKEFRAAVNRMPANEPVTPDLLEDALVIAKRRTGWDNSRVSDQAKEQAKEQAQKARSGAAASGKGSKGKKGEGNPAASRVTDLWPNKSEDRQKKVEEVKAKKFGSK